MVDAFSCADEPGIKTACNCYIGRPLDDGSAIGEKRQLVGLAPEPQREFVAAHSAMLQKPLFKFAQVDCSSLLMDLNRVSSAKRDVRPILSGQVWKLVLCATSAIGPRRICRNLGIIGPPDVLGEQRAPHQ